MDRSRVPGRVDGSRMLRFEPEREIAHPSDPLFAVRSERVEGGRDQSPADGRVPTTGFLGPVGSRGEPGDGVVFMVAHQGDRVSRIDHAADDLERFTDVGTAVDVVPEKDHASFRMAWCAGCSPVPEAVQEVAEPRCVPVDVPDEVDSGPQTGVERGSGSIFSGMWVFVTLHGRRRLADAGPGGLVPKACWNPSARPI